MPARLIANLIRFRTEYIDGSGQIMCEPIDIGGLQSLEAIMDDLDTIHANSKENHGRAPDTAYGKLYDRGQRVGKHMFYYAYLDEWINFIDDLGPLQPIESFALPSTWQTVMSAGAIHYESGKPVRMSLTFPPIPGPTGGSKYLIKASYPIGNHPSFQALPQLRRNSSLRSESCSLDESFLNTHPILKAFVAKAVLARLEGGMQAGILECASQYLKSGPHPEVP